MRSHRDLRMQPQNTKRALLVEQCSKPGAAGRQVQENMDQVRAIRAEYADV